MTETTSSTLELSLAPVRKQVLVEATQRRAFDVFTLRLDRWWPKSHSIGSAAVRRSVLEPFVGGRWYAECEDGSEVVVGHVLTWEPPARFVLSWEVGADWKPDPRPAHCSELEVRFIVDGARRTRVELEHRHFERMGAAPGASQRRDVDGGWPHLLERFAAAAAEPEGETP